MTADTASLPGTAELSTIDGTTRVYLLLAHPSDHVRSPQAYNAHFARHGINAVMVAADVEPDDLTAFVTGVRGWRNVCGIGVTIPHKQAMFELVDDLDESAIDVRAVNTIRREADGRLVGAMFDGLGFVDGLRARGHEPAGRRVAVVGTGGAGRAIGFALARAGVERLTLVNRSRASADLLASHILTATDLAAVDVADAPGAEHDLVVNATSLGMHTGDPLPLDVDALAAGALVAEAVMAPDVTPLLEAAAARGLPVHKGHHMRDAQLLACGRFVGVLP